MEPVQVKVSQYWLEEWYEIQEGIQAVCFVTAKF